MLEEQYKFRTTWKLVLNLLLNIIENNESVNEMRAHILLTNHICSPILIEK